FHIPKLRSRFPGTIPPFEGFAFFIHTGRMPFTPFFERLSKRLSRDDMFPFESFRSIRVFLRLIPTTRYIDLIASVGTSTVEGGLMSSKYLCQEFLGVIEGIVGGILGKDRRGQGEYTDKQTPGNNEYIPAQGG